MGNFQDLSGHRRGRLVVVKQADKTPSGRVAWLCLCDCGTETTVASNHLNTGSIKSCGCLNTEKRIERNRKRDDHGMRDTTEYLAYYAAKRRCSSTNAAKRADYFDRGIFFKFTSFRQFFEEVGLKPSPRHSLDRIDNDKSYEPGNVRWATPEEQIRNQRCNNCYVLKERIKELELMLTA